MQEWRQAGENSFYIDAPSKIGIYHIQDDEVYAIDSGGDKEAGRQLRRRLEERGWRLMGVLNTHSHADHIGGNAYLQRQTGCAVFSGGMEAYFIRHPVLEPSFLWGGYPGSRLRHKFLMAQESIVSDFSDPAFPSCMEIIPLPGHSFDMVGFRTPDDVLYLGDCLCSRETLQKYGITFIYDVGAYLRTLDTVKTMQAALFVPSHAAATEDIAPLAQYNTEAVLAVAKTIADICRTPTPFETLLQQLSVRYDLKITFEQYALVGSTVRSYLSWMQDTGQLAAEEENCLLYWRRI